MTQQKITKERRKALRKRLNTYMAPRRSLLYVTGLLAWVQFLTRVLSFAWIAKIVEQLANQQPINLWLMSIGLIVLNTVGFVSSQYGKRYQGELSQFARNQLKKEFFETIKQQKTDGQTSADVLTVASQGIDMLDTYYSVYLSQTMKVAFHCVTILVLVGWIYPLGSIVFLISLPFIPVSIMMMQKRSKQIMQHYWATYMDVGNLFLDDLKGLNTLYTYQAAERYEKQFNDKAEEFRQSTMALLGFQLQSVGYMDAVMYLGVAISGMLAVHSFAMQQLSLFGMVFFVLIATEFFIPIREAGYGMHLVMMNTKMADRIFSFLDSVALGEKTGKELTGVVESITFDQVSYGFSENPLVKDLTYTLTKGELFGICGVSGRGKSTLAKTLLKRVPLTSGRILLNDMPISELSMQAVNDAVVYVSPDNHVFNGTILENLTWQTSAKAQEVEAWLHDQNLLSFVSELPEGLHTQVGENGKLLSPGQRQQLLVARAIIGNFDVYIFDEMTSSVDLQQEDVIYHMIKRLAADKIVMVISHKMKHMLAVDKVLFMDDTPIIATPEQLKQTNEEFKTLLQTQEELEAILHDKV